MVTAFALTGLPAAANPAWCPPRKTATAPTAPRPGRPGCQNLTAGRRVGTRDGRRVRPGRPRLPGRCGGVADVLGLDEGEPDIGMNRLPGVGPLLTVAALRHTARRHLVV